MTTLAFDGAAGASGDLVLGALVAAGADPDALAPVEDALDLRYEVEPTTEAGIEATRVRVLVDDADAAGGADGARSSEDEHAQDHGHDHVHGDDDHSHGDDDGQDNDHSHGHDHDHSHEGERATRAEGHGPSRSYAEVVEIVEGMDLPEPVAADALATVERLGEAEASVHGTSLSETHFHEVGADDAIADVVGAALLVDDLGVDRVVTTPVRTGGGEVETSHGTYPVPTPAVVEIAEAADWELAGGPVDRELLTPTGAALLAHYAEGVGSLPPLRVRESGYGAGSYDLGDRPNVLRAVVGEERGGLRREEIAVLETNVDDVAPEVLGDLQSSLTEIGAKDVTVVPTTMKKSRPGHLVKVLVDPADAERVARRLAAETGTLGVRQAGASHRWVAERRFETATLTLDGEAREVDVKVATDAEGTVLDVSAEYDDAAAVARATGEPVRDVARRAEAAVRAELDAAGGN